MKLLRIIEWEREGGTTILLFFGVPVTETGPLSWSREVSL